MHLHIQECKIQECSKSIHAKGMCEMHYRQVLRGSKITSGRPNDWGSREKHPLYSHYSQIRRNSTKAVLCDEWKSDFWVFVRDVGSRPSKEHMLMRLDDSKPYSKDNFYWHEKVVLKIKGESERAYARRYARAHRALNPEKYRSYNLKRNYGISLEDYNKLLVMQKGGCAICGQPEKAIDPKTQKPRSLAVDHCRESGLIRGLLCSGCNMILGNAKDSIELLEEAIEYLGFHHLVRTAKENNWE